MKKFYKLLILLFMPVLILCGLANPTYCSELTHFPADNVYSITPFQSVDGKQNFYNYSNLQDVYYTNFNLIVNSGYYMSVHGDFTNEGFSVGANNFDIEEYYIYCFDIPIGYFTGYVQINCNSDYSQMSYHVYYTWHQLEDIKVNPIDYGFGGISYQIIPDELLNLSKVYRIWYQPGAFGVEFDIVLGSQYFYNKYWGIVANLKPLISSNIFNNGYMSNITHKLSMNCYLNKNWGNSILTDLYYSDFVQSQNSNWIIFENNYSYDNDYVNKFSIYITPSAGNAFVNSSGMSLVGEYLRYNLILNYNYNNENYLYMYSNTTNNDGLYSSTIIPNGSNDFYKSCEWWDIPTHLYNFFIYLVFDAPIISNFTRLAYIIIQFIVSVFNWLIALFSGISSSFFIAIFVGFIVLMFLLKIIFKG